MKLTHYTLIAAVPEPGKARRLVLLIAAASPRAWGILKPMLSCVGALFRFVAQSSHVAQADADGVHFAHQWGDLNCDGVVDVGDVLVLLLFLADLPTGVSPPCVPPGEPIG